jgi:hypothetical protein
MALLAGTKLHHTTWGHVARFPGRSHGSGGSIWCGLIMIYRCVLAVERVCEATAFGSLSWLAACPLGMQNGHPDQFLTPIVVDSVPFHATLSSGLGPAEADTQHVCFLIVIHP